MSLCGVVKQKPCNVSPMKHQIWIRLMALAGLVLSLPAAAERLREPVWVEAHAGTQMAKEGWLVDAETEYVVLETRRGPVHLRWDLLDRAAFETAKEAQLGEDQRAWKPGQRERAWVGVAQWLKERGKPRDRVEWALAHAGTGTPELEEAAARIREGLPPAPEAEPEPEPAATDEPAQAPAVGDGFDFDALDPLGRWGELTEEKHAEGLAEQVAFIEEAMKQTGLELDAYPDASEHFLLYTDLPGREARRWAEKLDRMQEEMSPVFGLAPDAKLHFGKTLVIVFERRSDFIEFCEEVLDEQEADDFAGFCVSRPDGHARIVFYRQPENDEFHRILVHEAAHAVVHRLRSPTRMPSWINEGIAELVDHRLVPTRRPVRVPERLARAALEHPAAFFSLSHRIDLRDYPLAEGFVGWLIQGSGPRFLKLFDALKAGLNMEAAFEHAYGRTPVEVLAAYAATLD